MTVSTNYPQPVTVNGYLCRNCTDVANAQKHIDPAHPRSGPYNINAQDDPSQPAAVRFGGGLSGLNNPARAQSPAAAPQAGAQVDLTA